MKKIFLISVLAGILLSSCTTTKAERINVLEDMEAFRTYVDEGSIQYYEKTENPETMEKSLVINPRKLLTSYTRQKRWLIKENRPINYENEVIQEAVTNSLYWYFRTNNFADGHLSVGTEKNIAHPGEKFWFFPTDCFLKKEGNDFFVISNPDKAIIGKKYTGDVNNLRLTVKDNQEVYVYSFIDEWYNESGKINLEGQDYTLPVFHARYKKFNSFIDVFPTEKSLYIRIMNFGFTGNQKENSLFEEGLKSIKENIRNKESVVIDVRGNVGGLVNPVFRFLDALNNKMENNEDCVNFRNYSRGLFYANQSVMNSSLIAKAKHEQAIKENQEDYIVRELLDDYKLQLFLNKKSVNPYDKYEYNPDSSYSGDLLDSKIFVLCDYDTASASEVLIGLLYELYGDQVTLIGENTRGTAVYGNPLPYVLPNSKVTVNLSSTSGKNSPLWKNSKYWKGEGYGFYPDYWCSEKNILDALRYATKDDELYNEMLQKNY